MPLVDLPKFWLAHGPHSPFAFGLLQIAIGDVVAVAVEPACGSSLPRTRPRVARREDALVVGRLQILAEAGLERRLAVAEHVVGDAQARRDVVEALYAL